MTLRRWEYLRVDLDEADLDLLGDNGWELVTSVGPELIFKRPHPLSIERFRERVTLEQKQRAYQMLGVEAAEDDEP